MGDDSARSGMRHSGFLTRQEQPGNHPRGVRVQRRGAPLG